MLGVNDEVSCLEGWPQVPMTGCEVLHAQDAPILMVDALQYSALRSECTKQGVPGVAPSAKCMTHWGLLLTRDFWRDVQRQRVDRIRTTVMRQSEIDAQLTSLSPDEPHAPAEECRLQPGTQDVSRHHCSLEGVGLLIRER
jgi:hypothetical protein